MLKHDAICAKLMNVCIAFKQIYYAGSAATDLRGGDSFNSSFLRRSFLNVTVKKLLKLVHYCRSYRENKSGQRGNGGSTQSSVAEAGPP